MPPLRNKRGRFSTKGILNRQKKGFLNGKNDQERTVCQSDCNNLNTPRAGDEIDHDAPRHNTRRKFGILIDKTQAVQEVEVNSFLGNRIVDLQHIGKQLFFSSCKKRLNLFGDIKKDIIKGLGSLWHICCKNCNKTTQIETSKRYKSLVSGRDQFEINVKVVLGKCLSEVFMQGSFENSFKF